MSAQPQRTRGDQALAGQPGGSREALGAGIAEPIGAM